MNFFILFACALCGVQASASFSTDACVPRLQATIDAHTGRFNVSFDDTLWLVSNGAALHSDGVWYSTSDSSLRLLSSTTGTGTDNLGEFNRTEFAWSDGGTAAAKPVLVTTFKVYVDAPIVVFEQTYPGGLSGTSIGDDSTPCTCFPTLDAAGGKVPSLSYLTQNRIFGNVVSGLALSGYPGNIQGGTPLVLFDQDAINDPERWDSSTNVAVISPLEHSKVSIQSVTPSDDPTGAYEACGGGWSAGVTGMASSLPTNFTHATILVAGCGIRSTIKRWGSALLQSSGKAPPAREQRVIDDPTVRYLSYWTDNGAFYYYHTDGLESYEKTIVDIADYHLESNIPVRAYQFDSWWYYKHLWFDGGLVLWEPKSFVFPNGLGDMHLQLRAPMVLHNRWFSSSNDYMQYFPFESQGQWAFPVGGIENTTALFRTIMRHASEWGMVVYEQDWLIDQFLNVNVTRTNVLAADDWLIGMGAAAAEQSLWIQYCMPLPSDYLMSAQVPAVNQIRVSTDYHTQDTQWAIGKTSMFAWAMGLFPFKDTFWTTTEQPRNFYLTTEPNPELQAVVSVLSTGPVGISDKIGLTNQTLVSMMCTVDGTILKPSVPATSIEASYTSMAPAGEVWSSYSSIDVRNQCSNSTRSFGTLGSSHAAPEEREEPTPMLWYYSLSANLNTSFAIEPFQLGAAANATFASFLWSGFVPAQTESTSRSTPRTLPPSPTDPSTKITPHHLVVYAPPVVDCAGKQWFLLGEVSKFVPMSPQRVLRVLSSDESLEIVLEGVPGESITFAWQSPNGTIESSAVTIPAHSNIVSLQIPITS